jgi:hypothetical protein
MTMRPACCRGARELRAGRAVPGQAQRSVAMTVGIASLEPLGAHDRTTMIRLLSRLADVHNELAPAPLRVVGQ